MKLLGHCSLVVSLILDVTFRLGMKWPFLPLEDEDAGFEFEDSSEEATMAVYFSFPEDTDEDAS